MKKIILASTLFILCALVFSETFTFKYVLGDSYTILSSSSQETSVNGIYMSRSETLTRTLVTVINEENGTGTLDTTYSVTDFIEKNDGRSAPPWREEFKTIFKRNSLGTYDIDQNVAMPVIRNIPIFPNKDIKAGDTWTERGFEAHDLRASFSLEQILIVPFNVTYTYMGREEQNGTELHKILAKYSINFQNKTQKKSTNTDFPISMTGYSSQTLYWNNEKGIVAYSTENFRLAINTYRGILYDFEGSSRSETVDFFRPEPIDLQPAQEDANLTQRELLAEQIIPEEEIPEEIIQEGMPNAFENLSDDEDSIDSSAEFFDEEPISAENTDNIPIDTEIIIEPIFFTADSTVLSEKEKTKLRDIATKIALYPQKSVIITGYTALAGSLAGRERISLERAQVVAAYLVDLGAIKKEKIFCIGAGAENPKDSANVKTRDKEHRRVEIKFFN